MRLAFYSGIVNSTKTGVGVHLANLLQNLVQLRPETEYISFLPSLRHHNLHQTSTNLLDPTGHIQARTFPVPSKLLELSQSYLQLPPQSLLLGKNYDLYHQMWVNTIPAVPASKLIVTMYDTVALKWPEQEGSLFTGSHKLLQKAAIVITLSEFSKQEIIKAFDINPNKVKAIYCGCNHDLYHSFYSTNEVEKSLAKLNIKQPYLLYVGGQTPRKNLPRLIEAFNQAKKKADLPHTLVLVGPLNNLRAEIAEAIQKSEYKEAIQIAGYVPDAMMPHLYKGADALLFPSLHEGFGLPVVEAMACGTTVVTANSSSLLEVAGNAGILVNPENIESITQGILCAVSENTEERQQRLQRGIKQAQKFSWRNCAEQHLKVYDEVIARSKN